LTRLLAPLGCWPTERIVFVHGAAGWRTDASVAAIIDGQPPRCQAMTGSCGDHVAELVTAVFVLLDGVW